MKDTELQVNICQPLTETGSKQKFIHALTEKIVRKLETQHFFEKRRNPSSAMTHYVTEECARAA